MNSTLLRCLAAATLFLGLPQASSAQCTLPIDDCGTLVPGVTCPILYQSGTGGLYLLDNTGGFAIGDFVHVVGLLDTGCFTICNQGNGCLCVALIEACSTDPTTAYCPCPPGGICFNNSASGGCGNSTGLGSELTGSGSVSVSADDLVLTANNITPNQFGLIYMGAGQLATSFGDGLRCVGAGGVGTFRFGVQSTGLGGALTEFGVVGTSAGFPAAGQISAGSTWNFQAWYRDPQGPCGFGFNLSNGVSATFTL